MRPNKRLQLQDIVNISNLEEPCEIPFSYFLSDDFVMYGQPAINYLHYLSRNWLEFKLFIQQNKDTELLRNIECIKLILTNHSKEASINTMNIWTLLDFYDWITRITYRSEIALSTLLVFDINRLNGGEYHIRLSSVNV